MRHEELSVGKLLLGKIGAILLGNGSKASAATVTAVEESGEVIHKTKLTLVNFPIAIADDAGVAQYGGAKVYDFPEGLIGILGCSVKGNLTGYASLIDNFTSNTALGTVTATTGNTLTGTEADIMASVANATAAAEIAAVDSVSAAMAVIDGTAAAKGAFLNVVIADNVAHGTGTAYFTGEILINWVNLGDN